MSSIAVTIINAVLLFTQLIPTQLPRPAFPWSIVYGLWSFYGP